MQIGKILALLLLAAAVGGETSSLTQTVRETQTAREAGNEACRRCHSEIYKSYSKTGMANASGAASEAVSAGEFNDKTSGVRYRVFKREGHAWMSYDRQSEKFRGQNELLYFLGAGTKGRKYLFSNQDFLFLAPVDWSAQNSQWGMIPDYVRAREIPLNLPASPDCVNCHSSGVRPPEPGTDDKYSGPVFLHGGITCQRCHGEGEGHGTARANFSTSNSSSANASIVELTNWNDPIVDPAKLPPDRRDAVCMECHFQGVAVEQPGKHLSEFQPGEKLSDYIHYFLLSGNEPETAQSVSQFEALSLSACKRSSGDKMGCGSCHDPHAEPAAEDKAAYYRRKCVNCHGEDFAANHHPEKQDCTNCHMPALPGKQVTHTEWTDHRIQRYPNSRPLPRLQVRGTPGAPLVSFPANDAPLATNRDFALAWYGLMQRNVEGAPQRAEKYLREALQERDDDPALLAALGLVEQTHEREKEARELYERTLKLDSLNSTAATELGVLNARAGDLRRAVELWQGVFDRAPYRSAIGLNLAMASCMSGQKDLARQFVVRVLEINPDYLKGKQLLNHLGEKPPQCQP